MKLGDLLQEGQIATGFQARDKWEAIRRLVDLLVTQGRLKAEQRQAVVEALEAREKVASTGMEHGVAIPPPAWTGWRGCAGRARPRPGRGPLPVGGRPAGPADHPPGHSAQGGSKHIRTLAGIARLLQYEEMRDALTGARTPREALQVIREEEQKDPG